MTAKKLTPVILFLLLFARGGLLQAQSVKVVDRATIKPVANVYLYNLQQTHTATTDRNGRADISHFAEDDTLVFQHPGYRRFTSPIGALRAMGWTIRLQQREVSLDEIYVSASKREESEADIPRKIMRIDAGEARFYNPQTSADLLSSSGKVFVQKSQLGGGSPMIRGFAANSVLLALDGIRMNNAIYRSGNLQNVINVDPNVLQSSEVIFGPGSVIYGSDALGGVMNFSTRDPELSFTEKPLVEVNAMARYASANNEQTGHIDLNYGRENWGFLSSISYSNFDDLRTGSRFDKEYGDWGKRQEYVVRYQGRDRIVPNEDVSIQKFSGYEALNLMQKIRYRPAADIDFNYTFYLSTTSDIPRYDRLIQYRNGEPRYARWDYGPQRWILSALETTFRNGGAAFDKGVVTLAYQDYEESRNDRKFQQLELRNREERVGVYTANLDFDRYFDPANTLYYGLELVHNDVNSTASETNIETGAQQSTATRYPDGGSDYGQYAGYLKYEHHFGDRVTLALGTRYSQVVLKARFEDQGFYDFPFNRIDINTGAVSGSAGLTYRPTDVWQFNLNLSSGFRAPNVDDAAKVFDSEPGNVVVPNEGIKPEYAYNLDLGVIHKLGARGRMELSGYYTWLRDAMVRRDFQFAGRDSILYDGQISRVQAVVNAGKAYVYGVSASLAMPLSDHWMIAGDITYTDGEDTSENIPLRHVAPLFGKAAVTYRVEKWRLEFFSRFNGAKPYRDLSPSEQNKTHLYTEDGTPAWYTLNLNAGWEVHPGVHLTLGMENMLDVHYRPYSSGISAPGRNAVMALNATF